MYFNFGSYIHCENKAEVMDKAKDIFAFDEHGQKRIERLEFGAYTKSVPRLSFIYLFYVTIIMGLLS